MPLYPNTAASSRVALKARRKPRQARSQVTVSAILDATVLVLLKHRYQGCTTKLVAEVAGVGIGSLYEYFPNREALIAAVVQREAERYMAVVQGEMLASIDRPFADALRAALRAALMELEAQRPLMSILLAEYPYVGRLVTRGDFTERAAQLALFCLRHWGEDLRIPEDPATHHVLTNILVGASISQMLRPASQLDSEDLVEAVLDVLMRILLPGHRSSVEPPRPW